MIELKSGTIQMSTMDGSEPIYEFNDAIIETSIEPSSMSQEVIRLNREATFDAELEHCSPLMSYTTDFNDRPFSIKYDSSIMVQARWHKKPRINKKWIKRYGMKKR